MDVCHGRAVVPVAEGYDAGVRIEVFGEATGHLLDPAAGRRKVWR